MPGVCRVRPSSALLYAVLLAGCDSELRRARWEVAGDVAQLRAHGLVAHVEQHRGDPSVRVEQLRSRLGGDAAIAIVGPHLAHVSLGGRLGPRLGSAHASRAKAFANAALRQDNEAAALRGAGRGLLLDAMEARLVPAAPVRPMTLQSADALRSEPSHHSGWGGLLAAVVFALGWWGRKRVRAAGNGACRRSTKT